MEPSTVLTELNPEASGHNGARGPLITRSGTLGIGICTVHGYALAVRNFAEFPTGAGENHRKLAEIFLPLHVISLGRPLTYNPSVKADHILTCYGFKTKPPRLPSPDQAKGNDSLVQTFILDSQQSFPTCRSLHEFDPPARDKSPGQLLFLRGHLSAEWIALIGSKYRIDPEFFSQTLDFSPPNDRTRNFSSPGLPGVAWNIIQIPLMTLGSNDPLKKGVSNDEIREIRTECAEQLKLYHQEIRRSQPRSDNPIPIGNSYVRDYHLFDETNFAFEHRLTICLQPAEGEHGWTCLVWSDIGNVDVKGSYLDGPWSTMKQRLRSQHTLFFPVLCNKPNTALFSHKISPEKRSTHDLHIDYGRSMRQELMAEDPFYALHEVFMHSICAERQFLNLLDAKLTKAIDEARNVEVDSLPGLNYLKEILYYHLKYNRHIYSSIKKLESTPWTHPSGGNGDSKHKHRNAVVLEHFSDLAEQASNLYSRCEGAITVLMNSISIFEARKSISQAQRLGRLTFLAFIFVPLSFTTSVFGMNVREIAQPNNLPSLKAWAALSIPVMVFALLLFYMNLEQYAKDVVSVPRNLLRDLRFRVLGR